MNKKKITFVIGAGASLPFITNGKTHLSTEYLTEQISGNHEVDKTFEAGFSSNNFNPKEFYLNDNVIAFLHGHIGFVPSGRDNVHFDGIYLNAQKRRISDVASGQEGYYREGAKGKHYNVSITSWLEKYESFYDNP